MIPSEPLPTDGNGYAGEPEQWKAEQCAEDHGGWEVRGPSPLFSCLPPLTETEARGIADVMNKLAPRRSPQSHSRPTGTGTPASADD